MTLNPSQEAAVMAEGPVIAVVAGPGSGKTRCLVERVQRRHTCHSMREAGSGRAMPKVVVLTFTNAGAHVLAQRLKGTRCDYIGTLHGWCFRLLQQHGGALGYRAGGINLVDEETAEEMLKQVAQDLHYKASFKALREKRDAAAVTCWQEYAHRLKRNNLVDFDTVLSEALRIIQMGHGAVDELYADEVQDSAAIDWKIYTAIKADVKFLVGDPDQSIYGFRGAYPAGFFRFCKSATETIYLEYNYRSGAQICEAATKLIRHNQQRLPKDVISGLAGGSTIQVRAFPDCLAERRSVCADVAALIPVVGPNEIAVICRTNFLADQFRDGLRAAGVPLAAAQKPQLPQDWSHGLNVLSLSLDPRNDLVAEKVLSRIAPHKVAAMKAVALQKGQWLSVTSELIQEAVFLESLTLILPRFNVGREMCALVEHRLSMLPMPNPTLADLVHDLWQHAAGDSDQTEGVTVCTGHGSKGKEWSEVFIPAFEQEVWQPKRDKDAEESRRLAFVAMTRAKDSLFLSHAASRQGQWGGPQAAAPCGFIQEAGL